MGAPVDPQKLEDALKKNRDVRVVAFVHGETSTGVQSDAKTLVKIAHKYDAFAIVDAVTTLGARRCAGRVGDRRDLLGEPEMPFVHAGLSRVVLSSAWSTTSKRARTRSLLVHGHEPPARATGARATALITHRADQLAFGFARGALLLREEGVKTPGRATGAITMR